MKIVQIISGDIWAGAEVQVYQTVNALQKIGMDVLCILFNNGIVANRLKENGINVEIIDENNYSTFSTIMKCRDIFEKFSPDLVHVHKNRDHLVGWSAKRLYKKSIPLVRTVHGKSEVPSNLEFKQYIRTSIVVAIDSFLIKKFCNCTIAVSHDMYSKLIKIRPVKGVVLLPNAIDDTKYGKRIDTTVIRQKFKTEDLFWIGTASRLAPPKNLEMLLKTAVLLKNNLHFKFKISIFGEGPLQSHLQEQIEELKIKDCVTLHGFENDIEGVIHSLDVFVLSSIHEGLPMALLEAMGSGKPVVCTSVGGMKEVISDGYNGFLVASGDYKHMAEKLKLLKDVPSILKEIGSNARKTIQEKYSIHSVIGNLQTTYSSLLNNSVH